MIDLEHYALSSDEHIQIEQILRETGNNPTLEQIWVLMDRAWAESGCNQAHFDADCYSAFYSHPVWLLNGMFIEQHDESMRHREAIAEVIAQKCSSRLLDFGGGFGTLARCIAQRSAHTKVDIHDPFPPRHGIESCGPFSNIHFVSELHASTYDALVCTDVLEHVHDPLSLLVQMVQVVRPGGSLVIANCFYPVIACHLPCTFHFRHSFDRFCKELGLAVEGASPGGHGVIYTRTQAVEPDWPRLRRMEKRSRLAFPLREWQQRHLRPWKRRFHLAFMQPGHVARKLVVLSVRSR